MTRLQLAEKAHKYQQCKIGLGAFMASVDQYSVSKNSINAVLAAVHLSDEILMEAFNILFGRNWKKSWTERDKAREMRSIIKGDTQPCCQFENWVAVIRYLLPYCC
jgi:hypothetical protein